MWRAGVDSEASVHFVSDRVEAGVLGCLCGTLCDELLNPFDGSCSLPGGHLGLSGCLLGFVGESSSLAHAEPVGRVRRVQQVRECPASCTVPVEPIDESRRRRAEDLGQILFEHLPSGPDPGEELVRGGGVGIALLLRDGVQPTWRQPFATAESFTTAPLPVVCAPGFGILRVLLSQVRGDAPRVRRVVRASPVAGLLRVLPVLGPELRVLLLPVTVSPTLVAGIGLRTVPIGIGRAPCRTPLPLIVEVFLPVRRVVLTLILPPRLPPLLFRALTGVVRLHVLALLAQDFLTMFGVVAATVLGDVLCVSLAPPPLGLGDLFRMLLAVSSPALPLGLLLAFSR
ncbi:hypothetical protein B1729_03680 [Microbacterium sp. B35-04]|nr:hypothetical protein B1729_03680 [Microbacterium sp. B35-04]